MALAPQPSLSDEQETVAVQVARVATPSSPPSDQLARAERITRAMDLSHEDPTQRLRHSGLRTEEPAPQLPPGLRAYRVTHTPDAAAGLVLGEVIASGGMGTVLAGTQVSLDRDVAVKRAHDDAHRHTTALLGEALVTGTLQHPNVVPVYDLALDDAGRPILLMKRVEGTTWTARLAERPAADDPRWESWLDGELRVLLQVCHAVEYAHSRGIVHRDLKPDNVMIGAFGEVYVLDWGLALRMHDADGARRVHAVDESQVEGTLAYMAPEQAGAVEGGVTEHTDQFLLGATLFELLTGAAPHARDTLGATVMAVLACEIAPLPPHVHTELARICQTALGRTPGERYASVGALREALDRFLERRPAIDLGRLAAQQASELEAAIRADGDAATVREHFARASFGFQQALALWPGHDTAREGLVAATEAMALYDLAHDELRHGEQLVATLASPSAALRDALEAARQRRRSREAEVRRLRDIADEHDAEFGARSRGTIIRALGVVFLLVFGGAELLVNLGLFSVTPAHLLWPGWLAIALVAGVGWVRRADLARTAINRAAFGVVLSMTVIGQAFRILNWRLGMNTTQVQVADLAVYAMTAAAYAGLFTRKLYSISMAFAVAAYVGALYPDWLLALTGGTIVASMAVLDRVIGTSSLRSAAPPKT